MPAIVAALHDNDVVSSGRRAGQPERLVGGFTSAVEELHGLGGRDMGAHQLGETPLEFSRPGAVKTGPAIHQAGH